MITPTEVKQFWTLAPKVQRKHFKAIQKAELAVQMEEQGKVSYKGKWMDPSEYPCKCELEDPNKCWEDKHPLALDHQRDEYFCKCRCHTFYQD